MSVRVDCVVASQYLLMNLGSTAAAACAVKEAAQKRELSKRTAARGFNEKARGMRLAHLFDAAAAPQGPIWPDRLEIFSGHWNDDICGRNQASSVGVISQTIERKLWVGRLDGALRVAPMAIRNEIDLTCISP